VATWLMIPSARRDLLPFKVSRRYSGRVSPPSGLGVLDLEPDRPEGSYAEQQVDVAANKAMTVVLDRPDVSRRPELDPCGLAGDMVMSGLSCSAL
jgi:hypothetical protein